MIICILFFGSCSSKKEVVANYIETYFSSDDYDQKGIIINNKNELLDYILKSDIDKFEKYTDDFFTSKSLIIFIDVEGSSANKTIIKDYSIKKKTINIIVETTHEGQIANIAYYYFILELNKDEASKIEKIVITKNGTTI